MTSTFEKLQKVDWAGTPFEGVDVAGLKKSLTSEQRAWMGENMLKDPRANFMASTMSILNSFEGDWFTIAMLYRDIVDGATIDLDEAIAA